MTHPHRLAYLTGEYPAVSHTFILREVEALRDLGLEVITCSVRRTGAEHHRGPSEKAAVASTFYVLEAARKPAILLAAIGAALRQPARMGAALRLAWKTRPPGARALAYQLFYLLEAAVLARHLKDRKVTHLHNHFGNSSCTVAMLASALSGIPFSYTMHGPAIFFEPHRWRIDVKMARARFVACISHFCRSQGMIFAAPEDWGKLKIIHCAIHPDRYEKSEPDPAQNGTGKRLIFVGRLAAVKGVLVLLEAFAKLRRSHPDAHLTLVGDGPERARIEAHAARLGCADAVRFAGYLSQDEVAEALSQADIFTLPSFAEGVPVVLMEAMASTLPVIATRIAGISELVEDGQSGLTVPPGDVEGFATALETLLDDPELCARMGRAGRARVVAEYNAPIEAARLKALFTAPSGVAEIALRPVPSSNGGDAP